MTFKEKARALLSMARVAACAFGRWGVARVPDVVGLAGLTSLGRGIWLQFGEAWACIAIGVVLMALTVVSALRGDD